MFVLTNLWPLYFNFLATSLSRTMPDYFCNEELYSVTVVLSRCGNILPKRGKANNFDASFTAHFY